MMDREREQSIDLTWAILHDTIHSTKHTFKYHHPHISSPITLTQHDYPASLISGLVTASVTHREAVPISSSFILT